MDEFPLVVGDVRFVSLLSWYQDAAENPYGEMVRLFYVRVQVTRIYKQGRRFVADVHCPVYDSTFRRMNEEWVEDWALDAVPEGGIELTAHHIEQYEREWQEDEEPAQREPDAAPVRRRRVVAPPDQDLDESDDEQPILDDVRHEDDEDEVASDAEDEALGAHDFLLGRGVPLEERPFQPNARGRIGLAGVLGKTPGGIVMHLMRSVLSHVVLCTNARIEQEGLNVSPLSLGELMTWHSLRQFMACAKLPAVEDYWKRGSVGPITYFDYGRYMSLRRFKEIKNALRFENYAHEHDRTCKTWKIRTITSLAKEAFKRLLPAPNREISVDEGMIRYSGARCPIKRFLPKKPIKRGMKFFAAVDYETNIMFDFNWDDGTRSAANCRELEWGMTGQVVLDLVGELPGRGYRIFTDNYYTSIALARELSYRGHGLIGTLRSNRGVLQGLKMPAKPTAAVPKGEVRHSHSRDNLVHVYSWMDNGSVYLLDSVIGPVDAPIQRRMGANHVQFEVPSAFNVYNSFMGGVDKYDQVRTGYFGIDMHGRTCKWTVRAYEAIFNMAVTNASAAWKTINADQTGRTHSSFVGRFAEEWLHNVYLQPNTRPLRATPAVVEGNVTYLGHALVQTAPGSASGRNPGNRRRQAHCVQCPNAAGGQRNVRRRTTFQCSVCKVFLHPACSDTYHTKLA